MPQPRPGRDRPARLALRHRIYPLHVSSLEATLLTYDPFDLDARQGREDAGTRADDEPFGDEQMLALLRAQTSVPVKTVPAVPVPAPAPAPAPASSGSGFDDMDDDIPF